MFHFTTAFLDLHLKDDKSREQFLQLVPRSDDGIWSVEDETETTAHSYWRGFPRYTARGLVLEQQLSQH
jgi:hypothetical protein